MKKLSLFEQEPRFLSGDWYFESQIWLAMNTSMTWSWASSILDALDEFSLMCCGGRALVLMTNDSDILMIHTAGPGAGTGVIYPSMVEVMVERIKF